MSHSSQQEKKRKRPDDKRQNVAKKAGGGRTQQYQLGEQDQFGNSTNSGPHQNFSSEGRGGSRGKANGNFDQDHSAGKSGATQNSMVKDRYAPSQGSAASVGPLQYQVSGQDHSAHQVKESKSGRLEVERSDHKNAASQRERQSKLQQQDQAIDEGIVQYPARHP